LSRLKDWAAPGIRMVVRIASGQYVDEMRKQRRAKRDTLRED